MPSERGSASVVMVGLIVAVFLIAGILFTVALQLHTAQRLQGATDRAALAAADALVGVVPWLPCTVAGRILVEEGFQMVSCELENNSARVIGKTVVVGIHQTMRAHAGVVDSGQK
jgi:secretion/DNA translocation related TadE-like protein